MPDDTKPGATLHPLGPMVYRVAARSPAAARAAAAVVLACCVALLAAAVWLSPSGAGIGTHEQLGFPPCTMVMMTGYPCPTCGMTTAFSHTVRGHLIAAFHAQPAGLAFALAVVAAGVLALSTLLTAKVWSVNWYRVPPARVVLIVVLLVAGGWGYKLLTGILTGDLPVRR